MGILTINYPININNYLVVLSWSPISDARLGDISPIGLLLSVIRSKKKFFATFYFRDILGDI
jgi:hypothetical protein